MTILFTQLANLRSRKFINARRLFNTFHNRATLFYTFKQILKQFLLHDIFHFHFFHNIISQK